MRTIAFFLSLALIFTIPWENAVTVAGLGTLTRVIGVFAAMVWLGSVLIGRSLRKPHAFHLLMLLFVLWNMSSIFWSVAVERTMQNIETYLQLAFLAFLIWDLYTTREALRAALGAYILGAYVAIGSTVIYYYTGQEIKAYSGGRYAGSGINAGDLALILALGLPVAWYLARSAGKGIKGSIQRLVNYVYIPASIFAIALTASRMALFAIVPAIVYIIGTANQLKPFHRILILATLVGTLPFIPQSSLERLGTTGVTLSEGDIGGRGRLWEESIAVFSEHPLLGVGSGTLKTRDLLGTVAHNTFLSVLAEVGLIGFFLFIAILVIVAYQSLRQPKWISGLWLTVLAVWAIGISAQTWEYYKATWLFLSLVVISASLSSRSDQSDLRSDLSTKGRIASRG
jgi:O-antigen ligase